MQSQAASIYKRRRQRFLKELNTGMGLLFTSPYHFKSHDTEMDFHPDRNFLYLTGFPEPHAAACFFPGQNDEFVLYVQPRDRLKEHWNGVRYGIEGAVKVFGANQAKPIDDLDKDLHCLVRTAGTLHYGFGSHPEHDYQVCEALAGFRPNLRAGDKMLRAIQNPFAILNEMRMIKDDHEIALMEEAARCTAAGYEAAIKSIRPGAFEYEVEAALEGGFHRSGGNGPGFGSIVGSGVNSAILHYVTNRQQLKAGQVILIDSGAEFEYYSADVTRTYPISGKFNNEQRQIYDLVLATQKDLCKMVQPGCTWRDLYEFTKKNLAQGLIKLGLIKGDLNDAVEKQITRYFTHRAGHWLGSDVHDVGTYLEADGSPRKFVPGMVLTIEPGLYFAEDDDTVPAAYRGWGIRIEDNVLVTTKGQRVLTAAIPKEVDEIEKLLRG